MSEQDKRSEARLAEELEIQVLAFATPDGKKEPIQFHINRTIDISPGGMQIELDTRIPVKSGLRLRIETRGRPKPFMLEGEVRWTYQDKLDASRHYIGFRVFDDEGTDSHDWRIYVDNRLRMAKR